MNPFIWVIGQAVAAAFLELFWALKGEHPRVRDAWRASRREDVRHRFRSSLGTK